MNAIFDEFMANRAIVGPSYSRSVTPFMGAVDSGTRTSTQGMPQDTRREITRYTRLRLLETSRWLYNNMGLIKRFIHGTTRYSVGQGIVPIAATDDPPTNAAIDKYFDDWADNPILTDAAKRSSFWKMQRNVCRTMFRDGETFVAKASPITVAPNVPGGVIYNIPRMQWLETQFIGNLKYGTNGIDDEGFFEGIKTDDFTAAMQYRILSDSNPNNYDLRKGTIVDAADMVHIFDPERSTQIRGLPWLYHGLNSALDILDLSALEKHAAKIHAAMAAAIKKRSADAGKGFTGDLAKETHTNAQGKTRVIAFEQFMSGAGILQMGIDEEFQLLTSSRPSLTFAGFIDYLIRDIAWGFGVSPEFIWSVADLNGSNVRAVLEDARWFFEEIQDLMVQTFCKPIYMWVIARGIMRGELKIPAGIDPYQVAWQGPAKISVDQGKDGAIELQRIASGCGTWKEYWATRGKDGSKMVRSRIDELADAMEYAASKKSANLPTGVPFEYIQPLTGGGTAAPDDEEDPKDATSSDKPTDKK